MIYRTLPIMMLITGLLVFASMVIWPAPSSQWLDRLVGWVASVILIGVSVGDLLRRR